MPKIAEMSPVVVTWNDDAILPLSRPSQAVGSRDPRMTLASLRTAAAVFENKTLGTGSAAGQTGGHIPVFASNLHRTLAAPAAAGANQGAATALTADLNLVTAADGAKGVRLPTPASGDAFAVVNTVDTAALLVYPATGGAINALATNAAFTVLPGEELTFYAQSATQWIARGARVARGQHTTIDENDTVVTGLTIVRSVVAVLESDPVAGCQFVTAALGNQSGAPAAGSILIKTWKATATADTAIIAATTFSKLVNWQAVGA